MNRLRKHLRENYFGVNRWPYDVVLTSLIVILNPDESHEASKSVSMLQIRVCADAWLKTARKLITMFHILVWRFEKPVGWGGLRLVMSMFIPNSGVHSGSVPVHRTLFLTFSTASLNYVNFKFSKVFLVGGPQVIKRFLRAWHFGDFSCGSHNRQKRHFITTSTGLCLNFEKP